MEARFTNYGGAIQEIVLKNFATSRDDDSPYVMNGKRSGPALELTGLLGLDKSEAFQLVEPSRDPSIVEFRKVIEGNYQVTRRYSISEDTNQEKAYLIKHELEFRNLTDQSLFIGDFSLNAGTVAPSGPQLLTLLRRRRHQVLCPKQVHQQYHTVLFFRTTRLYRRGPKLGLDFSQNQFFITILAQPKRGRLFRPTSRISTAGHPVTPQLGMTGRLRWIALRWFRKTRRFSSSTTTSGPKPIVSRAWREHRGACNSAFSTISNFADYDEWLLQFFSYGVAIVL